MLLNIISCDLHLHLSGATSSFEQYEKVGFGDRNERPPDLDNFAQVRLVTRVVNSALLLSVKSSQHSIQKCLTLHGFVATLINQQVSGAIKVALLRDRI